MGTSEGSATGARSAGDDDGGGGRRKGLLLLLGLLALLAVALILFLLLRGGDDGEKTGAKATPPPIATAESDTGPGKTDPDVKGGTLTAGGTDLLPVPDASELSSTKNQTATGKDLTVQSVVEGEGFWVGTSETDRVYVEFGGEVGESEQGTQDVQLARGDKVDLTGEVRPAPEEPSQTLELSPMDGDLVVSQGIFVNADDVKKAG